MASSTGDTVGPALPESVEAPAHSPSEPLRALVIDDNPSDVQIVRRLAAIIADTPFVVESVESVEEAELLMERRTFDVLLLDYRMPREDGLAFLMRTQETLEAPVIMLTGENDARIAVMAIRMGAYDYLPKDGLSSEQLSHALGEAVRRFRERISQQRADERALVTLAASVEVKGDAAGHLHRMVFFATEIGISMGLKWPQLSALRLGAVLHDIGTLAVRTSIFRKKGPLTSKEWDDMRRHPSVGEALCSPLRLVKEVSPIVRYHHERWDGNGYPEGLSGERIPLLARIVSVVDAFDAMISGRPYRDKLPLEEALSRLSQGSGTQWDPEVVGQFIALLTSDRRDLLSEALAVTAEGGADALWDEMLRSHLPD